MINLNEPVFDSVLAIDAQLQRLQAEVTQMDQEFANYKPQSRALRDIRMNDDLPKTHSFSPEIKEDTYVGAGNGSYPLR